MLRNRIYNTIFILACTIPFAGMFADPADSTADNESVSEWPALLEEDGTFNTGYLSEIGDYVEDHFAFRSELITAHSILRTSVFGTSADEDVITGTDNWLYYSATLDDYQHKNNVSNRTLFNEAHNIALVQEWAESNGKTFLFTIAPNKNTLYPDNMPSSLNVTYAEESDLERLTDYLAAEGVNYVDMVSLFTLQDDVLYYARDSHWTETGAILAYNALMDAAGAAHATYEDVTPVITADYYGDLSEMLYPSGMYPEEYEHYLTAPSFAYLTAESSGISYLVEYRTERDTDRLKGESEDTASGVPAAEVEDASLLVEQDTVVTFNPEGSGSLYMFRDSFGNSLLPYMADTFESAVFSKIVPWDLTSDEVLSADVIIMEKVERHLPTLSGIAPIMAALEQNLTFSYTSGTTIYGSEECLEYCLGSVPEDASGAVITVDDSLLEETGVSADPALSSAVTDSSAQVSASGTRSSSEDREAFRCGTVSITEMIDGDDLEISGTVSEELCAVNGRIYAAVTDDSGTSVYEAFCVSKDESDYGYALYLPKTALEGEILDVRIVLRNASVWTCVCEYRSSAYSRAISEAEDLAAEILKMYGEENPQLAYQKYLAVQEVAGERAAEESAGNTDVQDETAAADSDAQTGNEADPSETVVSRRYIEDCGLETGYWDITYADGHHDYIDD